MKKVLFYFFYSINLILVVNFLCLSSKFANTTTIFISSLLMALFVVLYKELLPNWNKWIGLLPLALNFIFISYVTANIINQVLPSLVMYCLFTMLEFNKKNIFYFIISLCFSLFLSFWAYPRNEVIAVKNKVALHNLHDYNFYSQYETSLLLEKNKCIIVETYGKKCGQCIEAMRDLGGFFKEMEEKYNVAHEYIHVGLITKNDEEKLRELNVMYEDTLYQDRQKAYYDKTKMIGLPYFNFYNNKGEFIESIEGYNAGFKDFYKKRIDKILSCNCRK